MSKTRTASGRRSAMNRGRKRKGTPMEGERLELEIGGVAHGGHCVARHDGRVVFVRHTLPGERVIARVTDGTTESKFLRADAIEILQASPDRVESPCVFSGPGMCGGCDWQHASLEAQRRLKAEVIRDQMRRIAHQDVDVVVEPLGEDETGLRWRTRLELAVRDGVAGMRAHRSHRLVEMDDCLIADADFTPVFRDRFDHDVTGIDLVKPSDGDILGIELPLAKNEAVPAIRQVTQARSGTREFELDARGFWQVHPQAAPMFVDVVLGAAKPQEGETCVDLYCGAGLFTAYLAQAVGAEGRVIGVEADETAIDYARLNMGGMANVDLFAADVAQGQLPTERADIVVLDPPRVGAGREVAARIADLQPRVIVYVACDPAALARDVAYLAELGYELTELRAFDAFPMTQHVESIAALSPKNAGLQA